MYVNENGKLLRASTETNRWLYLIVMGLPSTRWGFLPYLNKKRKDEQISYFSFFTEAWANRLGEKVRKTYD